MACDKATTICDKNQYHEASFLEKIKIQTHFLFCKRCKTYSIQNSTITKVCNVHKNDIKTRCLSKEDKKDIENNLKNK